ncbi:MAG TPA: sigma-70 family RNA polymerase sigma factor, partial [Polyangia bacterium]|nr:sigma-70 family RNA polymerase sigma factor [Polyangia bacterium]
MPSRSRASTLEEIYDRYGAPVFRRARTLLGDPERARDATQEVFLRAAQDLERVSAHPLPWLFRVTTNLCLNNLRDNRRRVAILANRSA